MDDEQDILDMLVRVMRGAGYDTDRASNGCEALEKVAAQDYDVIITNIRMPVLDGRAFYGQLCALDARLSQRVIFCTGDIADPTTQQFLAATGAPVVFKPFSLSILLEVVAQQLARQSELVGKAHPNRVQPETAVVPAI